MIQSPAITLAAFAVILDQERADLADVGAPAGDGWYWLADTVREAISRVNGIDAADVYTSANSYFGLLRQAGSSHHDRAVLARAVLRRGHAVNGALTKTYRRSHEIK